MWGLYEYYTNNTYIRTHTHQKGIIKIESLKPTSTSTSTSTSASAIRRVLTRTRARARTRTHGRGRLGAHKTFGVDV